jgi:hypothetical protein
MQTSVLHIVLRRLSKFILVPAVLMVLVSDIASACACGCNVFTVGPRWMMATRPGTTLSLQYNYMNQYQAWSGSNSTTPDVIDDKQITTSFYTLGFQSMLSRDWGVMGEIPAWTRYFNTTDDDGSPASVTHTAFGDVRLMGVCLQSNPDELGCKLRDTFRQCQEPICWLM